jgi:hypothetical protein
MTILRWPNQNGSRQGAAAREPETEALPRSVLHSLVADLPGPVGETEAERLTRFVAQLAEVLSYRPRDAADVMLASHCIMLGMLAAAAHRDATRSGVAPHTANTFLRDMKQFEKMIAESRRIIALRRAASKRTARQPVPRTADLRSKTVARDDAGQSDQAVSAIIVPLHPAPKLLQ